MRVAGHDDGTCLQDIGPVRDLQRHLGVLLHQQNGHAGLIHIVDDAEYLLHQQRRQAHGGLVQQQHLGFAHQRAANGQHLLLTAGKRSGNLPAALLQTRQALKHHLIIRRNGIRAVLSGVRPQRQILLHLDDFMRFHAADGLAAKGYLPLFGLEQPGNGMERGRFARSVCANQRDDLALVHIE